MGVTIQLESPQVERSIDTAAFAGEGTSLRVAHLRPVQRLGMVDGTMPVKGGR